MKRPDIDSVTLRMENIWKMAEERIMTDIIRRIKKTGKITSTADYQINRLIEMGRSTEEIERILKETLDLTYPGIFELYDNVSNWQYVRNKDVYEQVNGHYIPPEENEWLKQVSFAIQEQTRDELSNLARSYGFSVLYGNKKVFTPFSMYYQQYVDSAIMDVLSGSFDYSTVIRRTVTQMTNSGLRVVDYATGKSNRVDVAVRRSIMTGISQITGKINEKNAEILGTEYFEVDWHAGARPEHRVWQGKVYSYKELETVCGLHTVTGLCGANCRHLYFPFVPGASKRMYSDEWLEEQNRKEAQTKSWNGKEYDAYGQTQKQRKMETAMRAQREKVRLLEKSGVDPDEIMLAKAKYQAQLNEYARFCRKMNLPQQRERIYYDMHGRVAPNIKYVKLSDATDKWAKEALKELLQSEKTLSGRMLETMEIYSSDGKFIMSKRGKADSVKLSLSDYFKLKNAVVTHNHPSGSSFSFTDLKFLKNMPISELRVSTPEGVYFIRKPKMWSKEINSSDKMKDVYEQIKKDLRPKYKELYNKGKISKRERHIMFEDEVNRTFAERFGIEYGFELYE